MMSVKSDGPPLLCLLQASKSFGAVEALSTVDFKINAGEVVGLMGDNGAGKSTLARIIAGTHPPTSGEIEVEGRKTEFRRPADARAAGIEMVHQDLALCNNLTAAQNVFLGREITRRFGLLKLLDGRWMQRHAADLFAELKSETPPTLCVKSMSGGQRQAVAIARTRLSDPKLVILDEPTAAISVRQVSEVLAMIRHIRSLNHAVILISHRMPDVFETADRIVVLRRGTKVADKPTFKTSPEEVTGLIAGAIESAW